MMRLNVNSSEKKTNVKSCKVLNFKKLIHENVNNVLTIILIQILEEMNFNSESNTSEIKKTAHMKSNLLISIFSKKTHMISTIKSDFRTSESDWESFNFFDFFNFDLNYKFIWSQWI